MRRPRRSGFSLLEVLLATGILVGSAVALMELASIGNQHAATARDLATSQLICQTKLNEIVCGLTPAETVRPSPVEEHPRWVYWVNVLPTEQPGLLEVEVGAAHEPIPRKQKAKFTLVRWLREEQDTPDRSLPTSTPETTVLDTLARERDLP